MDRQTLLQPTELSQDEFNGLLEQLRTDLTQADAQVELVDAARYNDSDVLKAVLTVYPQAIDCTDNHENTPLHMAAANGHVDVVSLLLKCGANPSKRNEKGNTPLHWAASNGQQAVVNVLLQHEQVDVLQRNTFGRSALTEGFESQNTDVVQSLLEHKTATEERLMQTDNVERKDGDDPGVTHEFNFGGGTTAVIRIRELPIARNDQDSILGQANPADDTTGWLLLLLLAAFLPPNQKKSHGDSHKTHFILGTLQVGNLGRLARNGAMASFVARTLGQPIHFGIGSGLWGPRLGGSPGRPVVPCRLCDGFQSTNRGQFTVQHCLECRAHDTQCTSIGNELE